MNPLGLTAPEIGHDDFRSISDLLHHHTGIRLAPGKETLVTGRLDRRLRRLGLDSYGQYIQLLRQPDHPELRHAIDLLTTNETFFFREPQHFDFLRKVALADRPNRPLRLWSAASSTGEEAYSAAMVLAEALPGQVWEIVGTDVSSRVVAGAQLGLYPIAAAERIPLPLLRRHCLKGRGEYAGMLAVNRALRTRVRFLLANLTEDFQHLGRFDVIMLRNVMIYFDQETKCRLIPRIQEMLHPGGYLITGRSESLTGIPSALRMLEPSIYQYPGAHRG